MKGSIKQKWAYRRDNFMAKGAGSIFMALLVIFIAGFAMIAGARFLVDRFIPGGTAEGTHNIWTTFLALTDPGNMNQDNFSNWYIKIFTVISGIFGIVFFSAVIAFITTQLDRQLEQLKKGRSVVLEQDHILILGWNHTIVEILNELIEANESERDASVVIMSDTDKEDMDDLLNEQIKDRRTTRFITRTGEVSSSMALKRVGITSCKSVILLPQCTANSSDEEKAVSDARTLKTLLALVAACGGEEHVPDTVVEVFQESNRQIIHGLIPHKITLVNPEDMIAKITVQTSRTPGLGAVYTQLFGFEGCEFYFTEPGQYDIPFGEMAYHYPDGVPMGIRRSNGDIELKPAAHDMLREGDEIIMIAEDDSTIHFQKKALVEPQRQKMVSTENSPKPEKILILGWNSKTPIVLEQFLDYLVQKSEIHIALEEENPLCKEKIKQLNHGQNDVKIKMSIMNPLIIKELEKLNLNQYDSILILNTVHHDQEVADARNINILLLIRSLVQERIKNSEVLLISEVLNADNLELINQTGVNDTIISTRMISKILAQIAEEPDVQSIYDELFKEEGSEIYLKPLSYYTDAKGLSLSFAEFMDLAQQRDEICIGFRDVSLQYSQEEDFGIIINPEKDEVIDLKAEDCLIVLAEDEN